MNVLVVGGTGLIGRHAAVELIARGHSVRVLARRPPPPGVLPEGATFVAGDLLEGELGAALEGVEGVVHAAGADPRVTPRGSAHAFFQRVNVAASVRLFSAAAAAGATRGVFVTSFYHALRPAWVDEPYFRSRADSEAAALAACGDRLALAIVQPPWILGPIAGRASFGGNLARWARSPAPLLAPPGGANFLSARSLGQAIATALERGRAGARYLVGDENLSWAALFERFAAAAGRPRRAHRLSPGTIDAAGVGAGWLVRLVGRQPGVGPRAWSRVFSDNLFYDAAEVRRELGHEVGNLDEAIRACFQGAPR
jgi:nucleoside-diphosphate-sugar epimerase